MATAAFALLAYGYLVAGGASVERATLMAVVYFAGRAVDLRGPPLNAVAAVAALLVAARPLAVADPAFVLTFGATLAIVIVVPVAAAVGALPLPRLAAPVVALTAASVAAETALMPVGAFVFSRVTLAGLALNFAAIPLMAVVQVAGLAAVAAAVVSPALAAACGWFAHAGAEGLVGAADLVRFAPVLAWRVAPPHWTAMTLYYVGLVLAWALWRRAKDCGETARRRVARLIAGGVAVLAGSWIAAQPWTVATARGDGRLHVTFIDVGQGDAAFVRFPRGETLLVDAGGLPAAASGTSFDLGDRVVAPVLRKAGVRRLGSLVLTHGDADHVGGAGAILREFRPGDVWEGIPVPRLEPLGALRALAAGAGARWVRVQAEDRVVIDGVEVVVRHPRPADWERQEVRNDDSIVLELLWGDVSIVLTGDIGREVEQAIAGSFAPSPMRVVKVPHHGSLTSSTPPFVRALSARVAVVSAGRGNRFGHPAPEVVARYARAGAEVFRTDQDGAVMVGTDGREVEVSTFMGRRVRLR
jgi:competence protein ComEC